MSDIRTKTVLLVEGDHGAVSAAVKALRDNGCCVTIRDAKDTLGKDCVHGSAQEALAWESAFHENARELATRLVMAIGASTDLRTCMSALTGSLRDWSGCEAIGIRLREGDDYPYYETNGFPAKFVAYERTLCAYAEDGSIKRDGAGDPVLECICGNVLCGRFDPAKPFFTAKGSFWSNCTSDLLASTTDADRQAHTRNRCNGEGYESVALIPLRYGTQVFGLLQFNDFREGQFTRALIEQLEHLADDLAVALSRRLAEQSLMKSEERNRNLLGELQHRAKNSLGMIYSMINLASMGGVSPETRAVLGDMGNRVRSISELYSMLYSSDYSATIQLDDYCVRVASPLVGLSDRIELKTVLARVLAPVKIAVPIGLILTELVTNAIKYAFPGDSRGLITVTLKQSANGIILKVADDGAGLPEGFDCDADSGLGLSLVRALATQIEGAFTIGRGNRGTVCNLECPVSPDRHDIPSHPSSSL